MGDVIVGIDQLAATDDLTRLLESGRIGRAIELGVPRAGQLVALSVIPGERS